ncbi:MAG: tripartite tricarboxylate transporter TctB family protein [Pseudomonadales bacterium]|nr:tripartite tricarboxylate transporter TctB family protein [Pseudomonadales bacterium]MCP5185488.1 tripartite tricarboxylate transporter TctB family protein [Pseudomonadales bacterium]
MRRFLPGLVVLTLAAVYGWQVMDIAILPADAREAMSARTLPLVLTAAMTVIGVLLLVTAHAQATASSPVRRGDGRKAVGLLGVCALSATLLDPLGVPVTTALTLAAGMWLLGERRILPLLAIPAFVSVVLVVLLLLLAIDLPAGSLWSKHV